MFSYVSPEQRVPADHPLRRDPRRWSTGRCGDVAGVRRAVLGVGRPSIAPERLLRALLLQVLYTMRSERMLMEQLDYNLLFRWFVGLNDGRAGVGADGVQQEPGPAAGRGRSRERSSSRCWRRRRQRHLLSDEHFTVDGTLIEAWASQKSFQPQGRAAGAAGDDPGNPTVDFHGEKRSNETHESTTDPDARLARKSGGARGQAGLLRHTC